MPGRRSLQAMLPKAPWTVALPFALAAALVCVAAIDPSRVPWVGGLFAASLVLLPLWVAPTALSLVRLGADGPVARLASFSTRTTIAVWFVLGALTLHVVVSDVAHTGLGLAVAVMVAGATIVASGAVRLTAVSLLAVSTIPQEYPRGMARALAAIRVATATGIVSIVVAESVAWLAWAMGGVTFALLALAGTTLVSTVSGRDRWKRRNLDALRAIEPAFAIHLSGPSGSAYQLTMWLPLLDRAELPYVVIVRDATLFHEVSAVSTVPVVFSRTLGDLDLLVTLGFGTVFYVNNGVKNGHLVRRHNLHHIQLLHGESDKVSSRNPVAAMFDSLFVAGQAAVDRYWNHGIHIPRERFTIVGRPQVDGIEAVAPRPADQPATVLYAPTWNGFFGDANYSSLAVGERIVQSLLDEGARVIFRPHPYSNASPVLRETVARIDGMLAAHGAAAGVDHVFGPRATTEATTTDCFNWSDAMVSDVSSVPIDYLFSEKPLAIVEMLPGSLDRTPGCATLAVGAYVATPDADFTLMARELITTDTKAAERAKSREYYLADFPRDGYADVFVQTVREVVDLHRLPGPDDDGVDPDAALAEAEEDGDNEG